MEMLKNHLRENPPEPARKPVQVGTRKGRRAKEAMLRREARQRARQARRVA